MTRIVREKADLVVPPSVRRMAGIKAGDRLEFKTVRGMIDAQLAESLEDVKQGRVYGPFFERCALSPANRQEIHGKNIIHRLGNGSALDIISD